jgi:hypothetical protein
MLVLLKKIIVIFLDARFSILISFDEGFFFDQQSGTGDVLAGRRLFRAFFDTTGFMEILVRDRKGVQAQFFSDKSILSLHWRFAACQIV